MDYPKTFDCIVVGGGHAGTEAALAAARIGAHTLLLTQNIETLGQMSCNPAIGGIGKGHLAREVDALGGAMARATDRAGIHFRTLNASKGPAVRATRAQADRVLYRQAIRALVEAEPRLMVLQQGVEDLLLGGERITGVLTQMGLRVYAPTVVLTVGTFLAGKIHVGDVNYAGGRAGDPASVGLAHKLRDLGLAVGRLKTGTPPRLDGSSIDYSRLEPQPGEFPTPVFSFLGRRAEHPLQMPCHITHTTERTHDIIRAGLGRSAMFSGAIEGTGPRYCPSIEDKIVRFAHRPSHQIFVEPEGLTTREVYPNGISTSLPFDVQHELVRSIPGFEQAHITRPGYAIEYDFFDPRDLKPTLETRAIEGLFFAGQINGTTGYEEAAAQGIVAGINAALRVQEREPWYPRRDEAYIGVLIDDLITRGTAEPYRMFTSRAEYRLMLREDNADARLTPVGRELGVVDDERWRAFELKQGLIEAERARLQRIVVRPSDVPAAGAVGALTRETRALELLRRPGVSYEAVTALERVGPAPRPPNSDGAPGKVAPHGDAQHHDMARGDSQHDDMPHDHRAHDDCRGVAAPVGAATPDANSWHGNLHAELLEQVARALEVDARYAGYIDRQAEEIERQRRHMEMPLPTDLDYAAVAGLSNEVRETLARGMPETLGQAARMSGMTPAAVSLLLIHLKKRHGQGGAPSQSDAAALPADPTEPRASAPRPRPGKTRQRIA